MCRYKEYTETLNNALKTMTGDNSGQDLSHISAKLLDRYAPKSLWRANGTNRVRRFVKNLYKLC